VKNIIFELVQNHNETCLLSRTSHYVMISAANNYVIHTLHRFANCVIYAFNNN